MVFGKCVIYIFLWLCFKWKKCNTLYYIYDDIFNIIICIMGIILYNIKIFIKSPWTVDHLVRRSMKNAANCASTCELQDTWTLIFRTHIAVLGYYFQTTPDWGSCLLNEQDWLYVFYIYTIDFGVFSSYHISYENKRYCNMNCTLKYVTSVIGKVIEKLLNHTR